MAKEVEKVRRAQAKNIPQCPNILESGKEPNRTFYTIDKGKGYYVEEQNIINCMKNNKPQNISVKIYKISNPKNCTTFDFNKNNLIKTGNFFNLPGKMQLEIAGKYSKYLN